MTIPINVRDNPGFAAVGLEVKYNPSAFTVVGMSAASDALPLVILTDFGIVPQTGVQSLTVYVIAAVLTLSTCVSRGQDYERLIIQGMLVE